MSSSKLDLAYHLHIRDILISIGEWYPSITFDLTTYTNRIAISRRKSGNLDKEFIQPCPSFEVNFYRYSEGIVTVFSYFTL